MRGQQDPNTQDSLRLDPTVLIDAFNGSAQELADQNRIVMREMMQTFGKASEYEAFTVALGPGSIYSLMGFDLSRMLFKITPHGGNVYIGKRTDVNAGGGYLLTAESEMELHTVAEVFALNPTAGAVTISVYVEKSAQ